MLDIVTGRALKLIVTGIQSDREIRSEISTFLEVNDDSLLAEAVGTILNRLEEVGLVAPIE